MQKAYFKYTNENFLFLNSKADVGHSFIIVFYFMLNIGCIFKNNQKKFIG